MMCCGTVLELAKELRAGFRAGAEFLSAFI